MLEKVPNMWMDLKQERLSLKSVLNKLG
ncbi:hypothetical protein LINPERHAP1_LOCUS4644 [Linum perenne]